MSGSEDVDVKGRPRKRDWRYAQTPMMFEPVEGIPWTPKFLVVIPDDITGSVRVEQDGLYIRYTFENGVMVTMETAYHHLG